LSVLKNRIMRIGIDARLVPYEKKEGMAYYALSLIENLPKIDKTNDYTFFYNIFLRGNKRFAPDINNFNNCKNKFFPIPGRVLDFLWTKAKFPPIEFFLGNLDIFHTTAVTSTPPYNYLPPQRKGKKIITIHDITPLLLPEPIKSVFDLSQYKKGLDSVVKNADAIICISESTKDALIEYTGISRDKVYVVHFGISDDFFKETREDRIKSVLNKYRINSKYIFNIGRLDYGKNTVNLIKAFNILRKNHNLKLVLTGNKGDAAEDVFKAIDILGLSGDIIYLGYVVKEDLISLLSAAELFVFPSFYEGFGLPNLEAMKCETPVVTSDIAVMRELIGDAALLADPNSPGSIAEAMIKVINDDNLRNVLVSRGKEKVKAFSWERTARDTVEVYRKVAGS